MSASVYSADGKISSSSHSNYIGMSLFHPGAFNVTAGLVLDKTTLKLSFGDGLLLKVRGVEVGATVYRWPNAHKLRSVQIITGEKEWADGSVGGSPDEWNYAGVGLTYRTGDFFFEPSLTKADGDRNSIEFVLQMGWLWDM